MTPKYSNVGNTSCKAFVRPNSGLRTSVRAFSSSGKAPVYYLGIDYGTSGARCTLIDQQKKIIFEKRESYDEDLGGSSSPSAWSDALETLLGSLQQEHLENISAIAIDGTSSTALIVDRTTGRPISEPKMYNEAQDERFVEEARSIAPPDHTTIASTSTLCKAFAFLEEMERVEESHNAMLLHQADWIGYQFHSKMGVTDWNNALKLGFDPGAEEYPDWLLSKASKLKKILPMSVQQPGSIVSPISPAAANKFGISKSCNICAGTTDSIAAFLASGAHKPGQAVTSLGSTLAIKLLSSTRLDAATHGIYSHRLGSSWLVGGASNTGGAVLRSFFSDTELEQLTGLMDPTHCTGLDYVALLSPGERLPYDPKLQPRLEPRPDKDEIFLQGMLEAMARTEAAAYDAMRNMGATPVTEILTCGGGARNTVWTTLRQNAIGVPVRVATHGEASFGAALLALRSSAL